MKLLIYGAGVIGSVYASRLHDANHDVTLLARALNYENLHQNGIRLKNVLTGVTSISKVPLTKNLNREDCYDIIIVTVRFDQVKSVLVELKNNINSPVVMFMLNNPEGVNYLRDQLETKRVLLGFPGVGGIHQDGVINYIQIRQQKTTIGEIDGASSSALIGIKSALEMAGFEVAVSTHMQSWLKIHAVFVACVAAAITIENDDCMKLGKSKASVQTMVRAIREGFIACKSLGIVVTPPNLNMIFIVMPNWFAVWYWQRAMRSNMGMLAMTPHVKAARGEMILLASVVLEMVGAAALPTPTLSKLLSVFVGR